MSRASLAPPPLADAPAPLPARQSPGRGAVGRRPRRQWSLLVGVSVVGLFVLLALAAPVIAPYSPDAQNMSLVLRAPSAAHPFGTDEFGRDSLSRVLYGARLTLLASAASVVLVALVGCTLGLTAGFLGGWLDAVVGRVVDVLFAFPVVLLGIATFAVLGSGELSIIIALALASVPNFARVSRSAMIPEKEREYVVAAYVTGASTWYIMTRTLLPNLVGPLSVLVSVGFAYAVLYEASLSFLGLGAQPPTPEWGVMLSTARDFLFQAPWYAFFPGAAIVLLVFSLNLVGDGLRDVVDPYRRAR